MLPCGLSWQNVTRKATLPPKAKQHLQKIQPNFGHRFPIWDSNGFSAVYPALCLPTLPPSRNGWDSPPSVAMWGKRDMARRSSVDDVSPYKGQVDPHSELLMTSCAFFGSIIGVSHMYSYPCVRSIRASSVVIACRRPRVNPNVPA